jgi:hypothetical protein
MQQVARIAGAICAAELAWAREKTGRAKAFLALLISKYAMCMKGPQGCPQKR